MDYLYSIIIKKENIVKTLKMPYKNFSQSFYSFANVSSQEFEVEITDDNLKEFIFMLLDAKSEEENSVNSYYYICNIYHYLLENEFIVVDSNCDLLDESNELKVKDGVKITFAGGIDNSLPSVRRRLKAKLNEFENSLNRLLQGKNNALNSRFFSIEEVSKMEFPSRMIKNYYVAKRVYYALDIIDNIRRIIKSVDSFEDVEKIKTIVDFINDSDDFDLILLSYKMLLEKENEKDCIPSCFLIDSINSF